MIIINPQPTEQKTDSENWHNIPKSTGLVNSSTKI